MTERKSILLLGNYRPSLVMARKFNALGYKVVVGTHGCERLCQFSSCVSEMWDHSSLNEGASRLAEELNEYANQNPELYAIFPVSEEYVRIIAENEELFLNLPHIVTMKSDLVKRCLDKTFMLDLASANNVDTAEFACTRGMGEALKASRDRVGFPLIARPKDSTQRIDGNKAVCINDENEMVAFFRRNNLEHQTLLLQRKFLGKRHNVYFAAFDGKITRVLHAVIDRTDKADDTGLAVEGRTLEATGPIIEQTERLVGALNYSGIGCAQFLVNETTGASSFLEINPRIAGNHALPEHVGLDLAGFNLERVVNGKSDTKHIIGTSGLKYCWTTGDLMGAKVAFLKGEVGLTSLIRWIGRALLTSIRSDVHMVFSFRDPSPALHALWNFVPRLTRWRKPKISPGENTIYANDHRRPT
ncbi:MAG: hypothetical protein QNJ29_04590 [Rhizobiaceae bacterium]|nr:hypothetical protein [Rhizobiaceae bacterium]